jgi:hypothetical protein
MFESTLLEKDCGQHVLWFQEGKLGIEAKGHRLEKLPREARFEELKLINSVVYCSVRFHLIINQIDLIVGADWYNWDEV